MTATGRATKAGRANGVAPPIPQGDALILAVFPQTGLVQTYDLDLTDGNGDGFADNLFNFAQRGMASAK